jgi:hypothetical protein
MNVKSDLEKLEETVAFGKSKIGVTRKSHSLSKKAIKAQKKSRRINIKRANKKFRATGSKSRK